jgi:hypothetical protein
MAFAAAMFNTVCEAEGAARAILRSTDLQQIILVARDVSKREVLEADLVTRNRIPYNNLVENVHITDRLPQWCLDDFHAANQQEKWYLNWLSDDYVSILKKGGVIQ